MKSEAYIGKPHPGLKNKILVSGKGRYVDDIKLPAMSYMAVHRSPHAHARILSIDDSEARRLPGVLDVVTGEEIKRETKRLPTMLDTRALEDKQGLILYALSTDRETRRLKPPRLSVKWWSA